MNIVFDIGGTNMRVAAEVNGELGEIRKVPTPKDPEEGIRTFVAIAKELAAGDIHAMGGAIAADYVRNGALSGATNLPAWNGVDFVGELRNAFGAPVAIANDTVVIGLAEKERGAGKGFSKIAYITVSTGVGGSCVGESVEESPILRELESEIGDIESQISGTAVTKKFGIHPKDLDSLEERNKLADILAVALAKIAKAWKPQAFVIGGSMIVGVNPIPLERVAQNFNTVPVKMASLGDNGGLIGGMILADRL